MIVVRDIFQINWNKNLIKKENGLIFENKANLRVVSISVDSKISQDTDNIRFYPQVSSAISLPLLKSAKNFNQTLTPIIMPIIAPYNNYTEAQTISNSNLFSTNRAISIKEWENILDIAKLNVLKKLKEYYKDE